MRLLMDSRSDLPATTELSDDQLAALYTPQGQTQGQDQGWLRVNMISTLDGAATGDDGRSGSINNAVDKRVYDLLRDLADVIVVGAGTAVIEGFRPAEKPTVVVTRRGTVPDGLHGPSAGKVLIATCAQAEQLEDTIAQVGEENVMICGEARVDLMSLREKLVGRGLGRILCEGGPHLLGSLLAEGVADEVDATITPNVVGGAHLRIVTGQALNVELQLATLLEQDGTLLGRWLTGA